MIDLYFWSTPNGYKILIFLEETGMPHKLIPVNIGKGEQFAPEFLKIAPNNRIPAIVDHSPVEGSSPVSIFESGAILLYLADKIHRFIPDGLAARFDTIQWLFWQMANLGPMAGQNGHFSTYAPEKISYAIERYIKETNRLYGVMNRRLADREFIGGQYSIADMACYPWIVPHEAHGQNIADFPHLQRWLLSIQDRPAVVRAYEKGRAINPKPTMTDDAKKVLFGQTAKTAERNE